MQQDTLTTPPDQWTPADIIGTAELARRTGTGRSTWEKRRMHGPPASPPFFKIGASVRYRWGDVLDWLEARARTSTSEAPKDAA